MTTNKKNRLPAKKGVDNLMCLVYNASRKVKERDISKEKIILFINMEGLDKSLFLCYNIDMINEIESFYFILSFAMKDNTRHIKPKQRA